MAKGKTLELTIRLAGKMDASLTTAVHSATQSISNIGTVGLAAMTALGVGTAKVLADCTKQAEQFESSMSNVVKYVSGLADKNGKISDNIWEGNGQTYAENYEQMSAALLDLSTMIPMTAEELTQLAAAAGQSGKSQTDLIQYDQNGNLSGFLKDVAMMGTAMDISAEQAGDWAAKWEKAFSITHADVMELSDQINYLGANNATTAAEIAQVVNNSASLGQVAGMSPASTAALATAVLAMGTPEYRAATSINRIYTNMSLGDSATDAQQAMWEELGFSAAGIAKSMQVDSTGTMLSVFDAIGDLEKDRQVAAIKTLFGQWAIQSSANLVGNLPLFQDTLRMVNSPELYNGSMQREFAIKSATTANQDLLLNNSLLALQIDIGKMFLPAKQQITQALIDFLNQIRAMPELGQVAESLAGLVSSAIEKARVVLEKSLPVIQQVLDYMATHGEQIAKVLEGLVVTFAGMKFAPTLAGMGGVLFGGLLGSGGTGGAPGRQSGGLLGAMGNLFHWGQDTASTAGNATSLLFHGVQEATSGVTGGVRGTITSGAAGALLTLQGMGGLLSGNPRTAEQAQNALRTGILDMQLNGAGGSIRQSLGDMLGGTKIGKAAGGIRNYFGGIGTAFGALGGTAIGSKITGGVRATGSAFGEIPSGIAESTGLTGLAHGTVNLAKSGAGWVVGKAGTFAQNVAGSTLGQVVGGAAGKVGGLVGGIAPTIGNFAGAGLGVLGNIWQPFLSGFGGLAAGALPIVGVLSTVIASVSLLGDHMEDIRGVIGNVFGEQALVVFDTLVDKISMIGTFITGLFQDGGVAQALAPLRSIITDTFDDNAGVVFDGFIQIVQSVMSVVGQVVTFANTTVKPIMQEIFHFIVETVVPLVLQAFTAAAPIIADILSGLGTAIMTVAQIIGDVIQAALPYIEDVITIVLSIASVVVPAVLAGMKMLVDGIMPLIRSVKGIFQGLIDFITGVFTLNWKKAWEGVKKIFSNVFGALKTLCKTPLNAVITLINKAISGINSLHISLPEWVPGIGGKRLSFNIPTIPMLANGGFTNGVSIAGEAGTEAVISFRDSQRDRNIQTWIQAGQLLGVDETQAATAAGISSVAPAVLSSAVLPLPAPKTSLAAPIAAPSPLVSVSRTTDSRWMISRLNETNTQILEHLQEHLSNSEWHERETRLLPMLPALSTNGLPALANGGFTDGVSIAGETGTEAVISFRNSQRQRNIQTWIQAGKLLHVNENQAVTTIGIPSAVSVTATPSLLHTTDSRFIVSHVGETLRETALFPVFLPSATNVLPVTTIPTFANGGFTNGVRIADETGTEAIIRFPNNQRQRNIQTWIQAGQRLRVNKNQAAQAVQTMRTTNVPLLSALVNDASPRTIPMVELPETSRMKAAKSSERGKTGNLVFSPTIHIHGNANKAELEQVLRDEEKRFQQWFDKMLRQQARLLYQ